MDALSSPIPVSFYVIFQKIDMPRTFQFFFIYIGTVPNHLIYWPSQDINLKVWSHFLWHFVGLTPFLVQWLEFMYAMLLTMSISLSCMYILKIFFLEKIIKYLLKILICFMHLIWATATYSNVKRFETYDIYSLKNTYKNVRI
jgi:hypothetical protein